MIVLRGHLRGHVHQMTENVLKQSGDVSGELSRVPIHMAEVGSESFEREFALRLIENQDQTLEQIEEAIERIEDGTYGFCKDCTKRIPKARLKAIPYTTRCIKCASQQELLHGREGSEDPA